VPPETRLKALRRGDLDLAWSTDASIVEIVRNSPRLSVLETPPLSVVRLAVNTRQPPLDRQTVRQAIAHALDRAAVAQAVTNGPPVLGRMDVVPPESPWFATGLPDYPFDTARARQLLAEQAFTLELLALLTYREPELLAPML
jgi:ABC-type transport system substrate-binding protein